MAKERNTTAVVEQSMTWDPKSAKDDAGNRVSFNPDNTSHIGGYYLGHEVVAYKDKATGEEKTTLLHKIKICDVSEIGDVTKVSNPENHTIEEGSIISIWGSAHLNPALTKHVKPGTWIKIIWMGKKPAKTAGHSNHHYDVEQDKSDVIEAEGQVAPITPPDNGTTGFAPSTAASAGDLLDDDDDLPM